MSDRVEELEEELRRALNREKTRKDEAALWRRHWGKLNDQATGLLKRWLELDALRPKDLDNETRAFLEGPR